MSILRDLHPDAFPGWTRGSLADDFRSTGLDELWDSPKAALAAALRLTYRQDGWDSPIKQAAAILAALAVGDGRVLVRVPGHAVIVRRRPHTAEPCYGQCHRAVQTAVG